ncbi:MAG: ParB/RepB/Spo0J family partition protein [Candidatus Pacebacteria bacterium]|nr:ParB/RepB/Spo0J family partition protein [Candidatus Paceibacterota bacterium]
MPRGIESLIPKRKENKELKNRKENIFWIEIEKIKPNLLQPRKSFSDKSLSELARSIEKYGILQPLIVRRIEKESSKGLGADYQIIAGERRYLAAKMIGLKELPVIIQDIKKEDELPISLVENIQREDLNPIEKAEAFKKLNKDFGLTQEEISKIIGISRESIANTMRLLNLPQNIKESIRKKEITEGHARILVSEKDPDLQEKIFQKILKDKMSVREVEKSVKNKKINNNQIFSDNLSQKIIPKVKNILKTYSPSIQKRKNGISLILRFSSPKELDDFLNKIS